MLASDAALMSAGSGDRAQVSTLSPAFSVVFCNPGGDLGPGGEAQLAEDVLDVALGGAL